MAKKTVSRATKTKRSRPAAKRDLVRKSNASAYAKRTATGRFKEMDDVGASQTADKRRRAKRKVGSGYGDQGDKRTDGALMRTAEWAGSVAGLASSRVAKGLRAAATTIGLAKTRSSAPGTRKRQPGSGTKKR